MKKLLSIILVFVLFFIFYSSVNANTNFSTDYSVTYKVSSDETTKVIIEVELTNKTTNFYASSYEIKTGFEDIDKLKAADSSGALAYDLEKTDGASIIKFDFNENVVGIGNSQKFQIEFITKEIAKNFGNITEVNIPGVSKQNSFDKFNVKVEVPSGLGPATFIKPRISKENSDGNIIEFSKNELGNAGIAISYGDNQIYEFGLNYHLKNSHLFPVVTQIAIPSNNNYQEVLIESISPKPIDVVIDQDGNWLAKYKLNGSQKLDVSVKGMAKILYKPKKDSLSNQQKNLYLKSDKYWEVNNSQIQKLAKELGTAENIYNYIVKNLNYDPTRVTEKQVRAGGLGALNEQTSAVSLEFTDLFITLARAAGIPSRAVEGWANTTNSVQRPLSIYRDVLHTWPQYWNDEESVWIMVDPTWGNTTGGIDYFNVFDFDHLAFVIKGADSDYPTSAGGYKLSNNINEQDVNVTSGIIFPRGNPKLTTSILFQEAYIGGFPVDGKIIITNDSPFLSTKQNINVTSSKLTPNTQKLFLDEIPPYGKKTVPIHFSRTKLLTNDIDTTKITIGNDILEKEIVIVPFYKSIYFYLIIGVILIGSITITLLIVARRSGRLFIPWRK